MLKYSGLLGICIPTYNRSELLKETLAKTIDAVRKYDIYIYISDNASSDNTEEVVREFQKEYGKISYNRNGSNLGADTNFELVLKMCNEKYAWLLGDDDYLGKDIGHILELLLNEKVDALVLTNNKSIKEKIYLGADIFQNIAQTMLWMSCLIVSLTVVTCGNFDKYKGTNFIHAGVLLEYLINEEGRAQCLHNNGVLMEVRPGYCGFMDDMIKIMLADLSNVIMLLPESIPLSHKHDFIKAMLSKTGGLSPRVFMSLRAQGHLDYKKVKQFEKEIKKHNDKAYVPAVIISVLPPKMFAILRAAIKRIRAIQ